uniref:Uncharacterized protein n=1 Tax=Oryza nivara TaxID=4536 RepID=A0A0E0FHN5_ORYNI
MDSPPHQLALIVLLVVALAALFLALLRGRCRCREGEAHQLPEQAEAGAGVAEGEEGGRERRKRRKARRRQRKGAGDDDAAGGEGDEALQLQLLRRRPRFPLASVAGALQRRITARYDDLARASQAHSLTIHQTFKIESDLGFDIMDLMMLVGTFSLVRQHSSPPESSQCSTPLGSESGGKRRRGRRGKQKGLGEVVSVHEKKEAKTSPFPLLLLCRATRRRITEVYDEMYQIVRAKRNDTGKVHEFINCLVDARNELLHKSEMVQRSCRIKKALLSNPCSRRANSYDRLCEQVHKLEAEHKRLKKDADIYNYIQEQLQMSESYKLLIELSALVEKAEREDALATEAAEMTFEELLAQEKSDAAFWQRHRKLTSILPK